MDQNIEAAEEAHKMLVLTRLCYTIFTISEIKMVKFFLCHDDCYVKSIRIETAIAPHSIHIFVCPLASCFLFASVELISPSSFVWSYFVATANISKPLSHFIIVIYLPQCSILLELLSIMMAAKKSKLAVQWQPTQSICIPDDKSHFFRCRRYLSFFTLLSLNKDAVSKWVLHCALQKMRLEEALLFSCVYIEAHKFIISQQKIRCHAFQVPPQI